MEANCSKQHLLKYAYLIRWSWPAGRRERVYSRSRVNINRANPMYDVDRNTQTNKKLLRKLRHASEQYTFKTEYTSLYFPTLCTFCYLNSADLLGPTSLKFVEPHLQFTFQEH